MAGHYSLPLARRPVTLRQRARTNRRFLVGAGLILTVGLGNLLHAWWVSPEHRIGQFAGAIDRGDMAALLSRADPQEVRRVGLTPEKLAAMLADAAGAPGGIRVGALRLVPLPERQSGYNRWGGVTVSDRDGRRLFDGVTIQAYNCDAGWRVGVTKFVYSVMVARSGMAYRKERYASLCARHGVAPEFYWPETERWEVVPSAE